MFALANSITLSLIISSGSILSKLIIALIAFIKYLNIVLGNIYLNINSYKIMHHVETI